MSKNVHFENLRFREAPDHMKHNEGGSCFLGYQSGDLVIPKVFPGDQDLVVTLKDIRVRISVEGEPLISPPTREFEVRGEKRRSALYWVEGPTREFLIKEIFSQRVVQRAYERALEAVDVDKEIPASS